MRVVHKNKLFEFLQKNSPGLDSFQLIEINGQTILEFKGSPLRFIIYPFEHDYDIYSFACVGYGSTYPLINYDSRFPFEEVFLHFMEWINESVKPYLEDRNAVDLWEEYKSGVKYLELEELDLGDLTYFSQHDLVRIRFAIQDLKGLIRQNFELSNDQMTTVNEKLDYLVEAAQRIPKTDWKGVALSILSSIIIALSLDTTRGNQLWELFMHVFRAISLLSGSGD
ncbi:MAG TPA: hypothetical protein VFE32_14830 [Puia sp.]|jgi:hypothetical protein|nr:hypothetical protein [Puia sp.]